MTCSASPTRRWNRLAILIVSVVASACASGTLHGVPRDQIQIEKPATLVPGTGVPVAYPAALRGPNAVAGRVVVEMTVGTDGKVDPASIEVVEASDSAFVRPVLDAVPTWRFLPYEVGPVNGRLTRQPQRIRMPIVIAVPAGR